VCVSMYSVRLCFWYLFVLFTL